MKFTKKEEVPVEYILSKDIFNKERKLERVDAIVYKILAYVNSPRAICDELNLDYWRLDEQILKKGDKREIDVEISILKNNLTKMGILVDKLEVILTEVNGVISAELMVIFEGIGYKFSIQDSI